MKLIKIKQNSKPIVIRPLVRLEDLTDDDMLLVTLASYQGKNKVKFGFQGDPDKWKVTEYDKEDPGYQEIADRVEEKYGFLNVDLRRPWPLMVYPSSNLDSLDPIDRTLLIKPGSQITHTKAKVSIKGSKNIAITRYDGEDVDEKYKEIARRKLESLSGGRGVA